jgi:predicted nucleic acid-binding protein
MTTVFVDTSGFYAFLDKTDPFHREAKALFLRGREENWGLLTSSLVVQET